MADKHPVRDKVVGGLILAAIISFITFVLPGGWGSVFHGVYQFFHWLWLWLVADVVVARWLFWGLIIMSVGFVVGIVFHIFESSGGTDYQIKPVKDSEGFFFGIRWRWRNDAGHIQNLAAFCPNCDLQIHPWATRPGVNPERSPVIYRCDDCQRDLYDSRDTRSQVEDLVMRKIQQKIRDDKRNPTAA
jgi:hypothetical protein